MKFSAALMNNTKWLEVWMASSARKIRFNIAWIWEPDIMSETLYWPVYAAKLTRTGFLDPGPTGGGPCEFRGIYKVRFSKNFGDVDGFRDDLGRIGKLPLDESADALELRGYER